MISPFPLLSCQKLTLTLSNKAHHPLFVSSNLIFLQPSHFPRMSPPFWEFTYLKPSELYRLCVLLWTELCPPHPYFEV